MSTAVLDFLHAEPEFTRGLLTAFYPWSTAFLKTKPEGMDWYRLSANPHLAWDRDLLLESDLPWYWWNNIPANTAIPWETEWLKTINDRKPQEMEYMSNVYSPNPRLTSHLRPLLLKLLGPEKAAGKAGAKGLDWTEAELKQMDKYLNWGYLQENECMAWKPWMLDRADTPYWWRRMCANPAFQWTAELIEQYKDKIDLGIMSKNHGIQWTPELLERYQDKWNWDSLATNPAVPWTTGLLERYGHRIENKEWFMANPAMPVAPDTTVQVSDTVMYYWAQNEGFGWTPEWTERLFALLKGKQFAAYMGISTNKALCWSPDLMERYDYLLNWPYLENNIGIWQQLVAPLHLPEDQAIALWQQAVTMPAVPVKSWNRNGRHWSLAKGSGSASLNYYITIPTTAPRHRDDYGEVEDPAQEKQTQEWIQQLGLRRTGVGEYPGSFSLYDKGSALRFANFMDGILRLPGEEAPES